MDGRLLVDPPGGALAVTGRPSMRHRAPEPVRGAPASFASLQGALRRRLRSRRGADVRSPRWDSLITTLAVFVGVMSIDLATKAWAAVTLTEPVPIADWLYLMLRHNAGMFLGTVPVSTGYWVCVCAALGWFGWRALRSVSAPVAVCVAAVLAGLTGNAIGQAQGAVVDFVAFGPIVGDQWLVVNVADLALVAGTLALGFFLLRDRVRRACRP